MKVIAASIAQAAESFLHAGYLSAMPRTFERMGKSQIDSATKDPTAIDLAEAFRLKGEVLGANASDGLVDTMLAGTHWQVLAGAALFFAGLALANRYLTGKSLRRGLVAAGAIVPVLVLGLTLSVGPPGETTPYAAASIKKKTTSRQQYNDPKAATEALLKGILADAVTNARGRRIKRLSDVRYEVRLPTRKPTAGMLQALRQYWLDGWGRRLLIRGDHRQGYHVSSAGSDGRHGNDDDLKIKVHHDSRDYWEWESARRAYYLRMHRGELVVLFHRSRARKFRYRHRALARRITGSRLFDLVEVDLLYPETQKRLHAIYRDAVAARRSAGVKEPKPLIAVIGNRRKDA